MKKPWQVPFANGEPLRWGYGGSQTEWRDNFTFRQTFTFVGFERGRSAAHALLKGEDGREFVCFLVDFAPLVRRGLFDQDGKVSGLWTFTKKGQNYGIRRVGE